MRPILVSYTIVIMPLCHSLMGSIFFFLDGTSSDGVLYNQWYLRFDGIWQKW